MVSQTLTDGHLETMEKDKNPFAESHKTWHCKIQGMGSMRIQEKAIGILPIALSLTLLSLTNRFKQAGYIFFSDYYRTVHV